MKIVIDWRTFLKADTLDWLLEKDNPSARYFTLTEILERNNHDPEVEEAKSEIMKTGIVQKILSKQKPEGYWGVSEDFYVRSKYKGTVWQLIILAELGADGADTRVEKACEFILNNSQDYGSGGFSYLGSKKVGGLHSGVLPCLTGNMVWSLIRLGYLRDPRVQKGIDWISRYQRFDDGEGEAPTGWPYDKFEKCWGRHTCYMGVVKTLKALAEIPVNERSIKVKETIERGLEYVLKHHIYRRSHDLSRVGKQSWALLRFPRMWEVDALEILLILTRLGVKDERMKGAVDLVLSKQGEDGKWRLEDTRNGRFLVNIEQLGKPSKWITLNALQMLKSFYG